MRCQYQMPYLDAHDVEHLEPPCCTAEATHVSCQPFIGTPTCGKHKCRCAKPIGSVARVGEEREGQGQEQREQDEAGDVHPGRMA